MTWQGQGGAGGTGGPGEPDDPTRADWPVATPPPASAPAPGGQDVTAPVPPPVSPPPAPATSPLPPPVAGVEPWAPPDQSSSAWGTPPIGGAGRFAVPGAPGLVYAGAIPRAAAFIVDSFLLGIVASIVTAPFAPNTMPVLTDANGVGAISDVTQFAVRSGIASVIGAAIEGVYFVLLWMSSGRATLGMRLFGLQVGNAPDGARLRPDQAVRRWLAYGSWLSIFGLVPPLAALVGLAQFAWTLILLVTTASSPTKQGLHDRFVGSAVVRPAAAGNGLAWTCLVLAFVLPIIAAFLIVSLLLMGGQMSEILSAVGDSI